MNIVILDDYQDAVRKLRCAAKLDEIGRASCRERV